MPVRARHRTLVPLAVVLILGALLAACGGASDDTPVVLSGEQLVAQGENLYRSTCAQCHGTNLDGARSGPPLVHPLYAPGAYSDEEFTAAIKAGVTPKHWDFGAMPMQAVRDEDVGAIIAYVRSIQRAEDTAN